MRTLNSILLNETAILSLAGYIIAAAAILFGVIIGGVGVVLLIGKVDSKPLKAVGIFLLLLTLCCFSFAYSLFG
ncbi:hypothetical protein [Hymenobacter sp. DG01]|uniref:hypothetical protein n=1 Tax=Hymenobacter sp. DG01 TaxID=2584940 RepID=UPI001123E45C|nr:hypothetical protein [Hymenobacter sp. DG01]